MIWMCNLYRVQWQCPYVRQTLFHCLWLLCSNVRIGFNFSITALVNDFDSFPSSKDNQHISVTLSFMVSNAFCFLPITVLQNVSLLLPWQVVPLFLSVFNDTPFYLWLLLVSYTVSLYVWDVCIVYHLASYLPKCIDKSLLNWHTLYLSIYNVLLSVQDCNPLSTLSLQVGISLLWTWWTLASLSCFVHTCVVHSDPLRLSKFRFNSRLITDLSLPITFAICLSLKPCCFISKIVYLCSLVRWLIFCSIW